MTKVFLAYASGNDFHATVICESAKAASTNDRVITPWSDKDTSGQQINKSVESWIQEADGFIGDISDVNMNVTYEVGYAIGLRKPVRLIRSIHKDYKKIQAIGLLNSLGHDPYDFQPKLTSLLKKKEIAPGWPLPSRNKDQPIFILQPPDPTDWARQAISAVKKVAKLKFRGFNPAEISRLNASEAFEHTAVSFGVVVFWVDSADLEAERNNQRAAFIFGLARGLDIPAVLIAHESSQLPLDLHDSAARWGRMDDIDGLIASFRDQVADEIIQYTGSDPSARRSPLANLEFGDPVAENEQSQLRDFFVKTNPYERALAGEAHVLVGRKGSGKSAVFLQVRDRSRSNKQNIVVDLMPEGYQLIKLKEYILDRLSLGTRKEVIAAFWEYILWLEVAYKILEKDAQRARYDSELLIRYQELEALFRKRVDTGQGDFSERLRLLSENIIARFSQRYSNSAEAGVLRSSEVLEIIYAEDLARLRDSVLDYLKIKGFVLFLFDNLDRVWTPGGFTADDAIILIGLVEAMQEISRKFSKRDYDFRWILFVRSDVYEFLISGMADYGKLSTYSLEWTDRDQMLELFRQRLVTYDGSDIEPVNLYDVSVGHVSGQPVLDYLVDGSLMRPRYLIRLFETARRRALTLNRSKIIEADYIFALKELGWQVLEDLDREIADLVPDAQNFLFEILQHHEGLTPDKLRYLAGKSIADAEMIEKLIDVMVWNGSLGIRTSTGDKYIFNTGYKRQYISSIIRGDKNIELLIHPTLRASIE